ncbi:unnamed protein product [Toxocara canis]|uniref:Uncharacterized protein n=1 Tax=Toxocara canis TaxID=6265 RepID=A0A3P7GQ53_TOXCA|nr:unnamed protein product [Toxocara canis]
MFRSRRSRKSGYRQELGEVERVVEPSFSFVSVYNKQDGIRRMDTVVLVDRNNTDAGKGVTTDYVVDVDEEDEHPVVILRNSELADRLGLNASEAIFHLHQMLGISLKAVCNGDAPELIRNGPAALSLEGCVFLMKRFATNMGIHLEATDFDIERLAETLRNDTKLDDILQTFDQISVSEEQPLSSTFILPVLKRGQYDHRTPPTLFTGQTVDVRVGIHIQSISNFELTTMMDSSGLSESIDICKYRELHRSNKGWKLIFFL